MKLPAGLKVFNVIAACLFGVFSSVQWNDLDPAVYDRPSLIDAVLWGLFYALIGVLLIITLFRRLPAWVLWASMLFCAIELVRTAPGLWDNLTGQDDFTMTQVSMSAEDPRVELSREFFGAVIALAGVGFLAWERKRFAITSSSPDS